MTARTSLYTIDPLDQEDAAVLRNVADLLVAAFPAIYAGDVTQALADVVQFAPEDRSLVARDSAGVPIGWLRMEHFKNQASAEIKLVAVHPTRRRQGVGRTLVMVAEERMRASGCVTMLATVGDTRGRTNLYGVDVTVDAQHDLTLARRITRD
ncbi:MAG: GNAT family N-acetyltransferase [Thermomicrobia bacterium]|nr:GNAT family N-acetyltransferase [Thermomicrobia bacterium]